MSAKQVAGSARETVKGAEPKGSEYRVESTRWTVHDMPAGLRPREEMTRVGAEHVSDDVLLAILLRSGVAGVNVVDLARGLLKQYGSLAALASASVEQLAGEKGMGKVKAQVLKAALEIGVRLTREAGPSRPQVKTPADAARLVRDRARTLDKEIFWVLHLDAKNFAKGDPQEVTQGLLDASLVHPREVFREAIRSATAAVVLLHNHPSGDPTPSAEDVRITRQLVDAGRIVDIKVLDHVVVAKLCPAGTPDYLSMREGGLVNFGG